MINERETADSGKDSDAEVSRVYRELADERAPERLNETVLRQAQKAARPPYARSILWTKPVAWAAVVAICLAITLQVTRLPVPESMPIAAVSQGAVETDDLADTSLADTRTSDSTADITADRSVETPVDRIQAQPAREAATDQYRPAARAVREGIARQVDASAPEEEANLPDAAETGAQDADMPRRAEDMSQLQSGRELQPPKPAASALASSAVMADEFEADCDEEARSTPASWLACIVDLEAAGQLEAAERQRKLLAESFPDFEMP